MTINPSHRNKQNSKSSGFNEYFISCIAIFALIFAGCSKSSNVRQSGAADVDGASADSHFSSIDCEGGSSSGAGRSLMGDSCKRPNTDDVDPPGYEKVAPPIIVTGSYLANLDNLAAPGCRVSAQGALTCKLMISGEAGPVPARGMESGQSYRWMVNGAFATKSAPTGVLLQLTVSQSNEMPEVSVSLRDYKTAGVKTLSTVAKPVSGITCPPNFVRIPANAEVGVANDFCVMKYEAKNNQGGAMARPDSQPWTGIKRGNAVTVCRQMGSGYDLMSNAHWQAVARNIESVAANWSEGAVGAGFLNRGFSKGNSDHPLAAGTDAQPCFDEPQNAYTDGTCIDPARSRTHRLSTGELIWDIAGNVSEWVSDEVTGAQLDGANVVIANKTWDGTQTPLETPASRLKYGPAGSYVNANSTSYSGLGYADLGMMTTALRRGGAYFQSGDELAVGIFASNGYLGPESTQDLTGFRCISAGE